MSEEKPRLESGKANLRKLKEMRNIILFACEFIKVEFKLHFNRCLSRTTAQDLHFIVNRMVRLNSQDALRVWESERE